MILNILTTLIKKSWIMCLIHILLKKSYPEEYDNYWIKCSYYVIHYYSRGQLLFKKISNKAVIFIYSIPILNNILINSLKSNQVIKNHIEFIKHGNIIDLYKLEPTFDKDFLDKYITDIKYDFVIFSDNANSHKNKCVNKKIAKILNSETSSYDYTESSIRFVLIECHIYNNIYKVYLKNDTQNYYIVDNIIDFNFMMYYLKQHLNIKIENIDELVNMNFSINIIDQDVNIIKLEKPTDYILIKKDNYDLVIC